MLAEQTAKKATIIVGLGKTGFACARFLARHGEAFMIVDSREQPPYLSRLRAELPEVEVQCGTFDRNLLAAGRRLIVSPGVALADPAIAHAVAQGVEVVSDIDLFCEQVAAPVVAITGSNAKTTVTTLVGRMAARAGVDVGVGGNIGEPVLDMLEQPARELYVLELSSFQLEMVHKLRAEVATILNISEDHMDRYPDMAAYRKAKQRIALGCRQMVVNRDDAATQVLLDSAVTQWSFGLDAPSGDHQLGLIRADDAAWLALGERKLLAVDQLNIHGAHNIGNALAALAMGYALGLDEAAMLDELREFAGLPHRCQWVADVDGVAYINDSKGTNVGATVAAIDGLGPDLQGGIVLIAGGDGKGADFIPLAQSVGRFCKAVVLIGKDAPRLELALAATQVPMIRAGDLASAVQTARGQAQAGDAVLLSPACASLDMFSSYEHRGDLFIERVQVMAGERDSKQGDHGDKERGDD